jgi:acyl-CoA thioesterase
VQELIDDTRLEAASGGLFRGTITPRWNIGPVPNGGYVLAFGLGALSRITPFADPVVATAYFVRPTAVGAAEVHTEVIKVGKRFATAQARIVQDGKERARILATFGTLPDGTASDGTPPDDDEVAHLTLVPPALPPRDSCVSEYAAGPFELAHRFEMALTHSSVAFLRGERTEHALLEGYVRFVDGGVPDLRALAMLADAFPPPVLNVAAGGWVPTLELTVQLRARPRTDWVIGRFTTRSVVNGLLEEDGELWDSGGRLLAISRQTALLPNA